MSVVLKKKGLMNITNVSITNPGQQWDAYGNPNGAPVPSNPSNIYRHFDSNPINNMNGWAAGVASFGNNGIAPMQSATSDEFESNKAIVKNRSIYYWEDKTHLELQKYMLTFVCKYSDPKLPIYNVAPIYKLNILMKKAYDEYTQPTTDEQNRIFREFMEKHGEQGLITYQQWNNKSMKLNEQVKLATFDRMSKMDEFCYLTQPGILRKWAFDGVVVSKSETEEPNSNLDHVYQSDILPSMGVATAGRSRVHNIWGPVRPGHRLFLVLTRQLLADGKYGAFKFVPRYGLRRPYETYFDESGRECKATVIYVGLCTDVREKDPALYNIELALGDYAIGQHAFLAHGSLPCIEVMVGI